MQDFIATVTAAIGGAGSRLWPLYLPGMIILAWVVWQRKGEGGSFVGWLFPRRIYLHASHLVDIQLFVVGRILALLGAFQLAAVGTAMAALTISLLGGQITEVDRVPGWAIGLLLLVASDFAVYWVHRVHHENPALWPFHAVHHSAEVMTPVTVYRKHPFYDLLSSALKGVLIGVTQGVLLSFFVSHISVPLLLGVNVFYLAFNAVTANLRHTHVWLSFGRVLEHVFISPAQHQVHHSSALKHYNKNYGEVLALWDWMFGTLYICEREEALTFGVGDAEGNRIEQPHPTLSAALCLPLKEAAAALRRKPRDATPAEAPKPTPQLTPDITPAE
ncbi:sterol desaturase family protein [Sagittula salina]|uniref:Sterol desaturase family protein n=1 Tax=Sagittula salina TaxID=2820268 RepID=A0A940MP15_9RHOB|nr:sterol desaturase family protein [Sagittula salina]MBP0483255.1 sterol desaturase family protein [Sagittula salina]